MKAFRHSEKGQALVIVAFALVALLIVAGLAIDGGTLFLTRRRMQNAADAASKAGARQLYRWQKVDDPVPYDDIYGEDAVLAAINETAEKNDVRDTDGIPANAVNDNVEVYYTDVNGDRLGSPPYIPIGQSGSLALAANAYGIEVNVDTEFGTVLFHLIGWQEVPVEAKATAVFVWNVGGGDYAVWSDARPGDCPPDNTLELNPSSAEFDGKLHSNANFSIGGSGSSVTGTIEYTGECHQCETKIDTTDGLERTTPASMPVRFRLDDYKCTNPSDCSTCGRGAVDACNNGEYYYITTTLDKKNFQGDGLYYVTGSNNVKLDFGDPYIVTIVAEGGGIQLSGSNQSMYYYTDGLLFFANGVGANRCSVAVVNVSASSVSWRGVIYAPHGRCEMSVASNSTFHGALFCHTVKLSGSDMSIAYDNTDVPPSLQVIAVVR